MRPYLIDLSWWQWSLITGIPFGGLMYLLVGPPDLVGLIVWAGAGAAFGAVMGIFVAGQGRRLRRVIGSMSAEEYALARRAAARGPVPADPVRREHAARLAAHGYHELVRFRVPLSIGFALFFLVAALAAVVSSPTHWLWAAFFAVLLAVQVLWPSWVRRRVERLRRGGDGPPLP